MNSNNLKNIDFNSHDFESPEFLNSEFAHTKLSESREILDTTLSILDEVNLIAKKLNIIKSKCIQFDSNTKGLNESDSDILKSQLSNAKVNFYTISLKLQGLANLAKECDQFLTE